MSELCQNPFHSGYREVGCQGCCIARGVATFVEAQLLQAQLAEAREENKRLRTEYNDAQDAFDLRMKRTEAREKTLREALDAHDTHTCTFRSCLEIRCSEVKAEMRKLARVALEGE